MEKTDIMFYTSWLVILIMAGIWLLAWALGAMSLGDAFLFWLLSAGILLVIVGSAGGPMGASTFQIISGLVLSIVVLIVLAVASDILGGFVGAAVGIILIGIVGLLMLLRNIKSGA